ncbi:MAG: hypothetical protein RIQ81_387 [Pseudomonadota bacterium]|jgi:glycosyltransferase involved in cell wall biosynthesis
MLRVLTLSKPYVASAYRNKLVELARDPGLEVGLITPPAWGNQMWETGDPDVEKKIWTRQLPIAFNGKNHFHFYRGLEAAVREFRPHIFNVEEEHYSIVTWQACRIAVRAGAIPLFYTWQNIYKDYPPPFSWIEQYVFRHAGAGITGNSEATEILRRKGFKGIIRQIPQMGVELAQFAPADRSAAARRAAKVSLGLDPDSFWVLFAGRLVEEKGVQDLLHALSLVTSPAIKALIIGDGDHAAALKKLAAESCKPGQVRFLDSIKSREVARFLQACDSMCLPSLTRSNWKEQFGRILVESMAAGAVCIGSSSGEIPLVIDDAGLVFTEGDPRDLARNLDRLATDETLLAHLRDKASERVNARYSNANVASELKKLLFDVAALKFQP